MAAFAHARGRAQIAQKGVSLAGFAVTNERADAAR
jgi:hypothetical protein